MNVSDIQPHHVFNLIVWYRISVMINLLSYMFLSITDVLLTSNFKCSHFVNKVICQFLIVVWCVHSFWFIEDLSSRTECEIFDDYEWCSTDDWVEQVVVGKLGHKNSSESVSLKLILSLSEIKLQKLINVFYLIICFWMKDSWKFNINIHVKIYLFLKLTNELKIMIWYNEVESIIFLIKFSEPDMVYTDSINLSHKHEYDIF